MAGINAAWVLQLHAGPQVKTTLPQLILAGPPTSEHQSGFNHHPSHAANMPPQLQAKSKFQVMHFGNPKAK